MLNHALQMITISILEPNNLRTLLLNKQVFTWINQMQAQ